MTQTEIDFLLDGHSKWLEARTRRTEEILNTYAKEQWADDKWFNEQLYAVEFPGKFLGSLEAVDLRGLNLAKRYLPEVLKDVDLSGANLFGASFYESKLSRVKFCEANLSKANLDETEIMEADFSKATLTEASISNRRTSNVNFDEAKMDNSVLVKSNIENSSFRKASLKGANFVRAELWNVSLQEADLRGANFQFARLSELNSRGGVDLRGADVTGANFTNAKFNEVHIYGVIGFSVPSEGMKFGMIDFSPEGDGSDIRDGHEFFSGLTAIR